VLPTAANTSWHSQQSLGKFRRICSWINRPNDFLRNRAPTWIYTTALTPADTAAALAAVNIVQQEPERRQQLWRNVDI
jgi:8-amino-7-oxononanoate synthase